MTSTETFSGNRGVGEGYTLQENILAVVTSPIHNDCTRCASTLTKASVDGLQEKVHVTQQAERVKREEAAAAAEKRAAAAALMKQVSSNCETDLAWIPPLLYLGL